MEFGEYSVEGMHAVFATGADWYNYNTFHLPREIFSISAKAGESYGFLAGKCGVDIEYECRTGNCQTCTRWMEFPDKDRDRNPDDDGWKVSLYERTILHCVGKVPRGYRWLHILEPMSDGVREV